MSEAPSRAAGGYEAGRNATDRRVRRPGASEAASPTSSGRSAGPSAISTCRAAAASCLVAGLLGGCYQYGPGAVRAGRASYNEIINRTSNEQLLLNLVRLKYRDTPFFLEISSITTSFSFGAGFSTSGSPSNAPYFDPLNLNLSYSERPTISYSPLQGDKFVKQLLSPLSLETLVLMYHSGWSVERVFRCCVQRMNGVKNAPSASGPTPDYVPTYEDFHRVAKIMRKLQRDGQMNLGARPGRLRPAPDSRPGGEGEGFAMWIGKTAMDSEEVKELQKILALRPGRSYYPLTTDVLGADPDKIGVSTRSLLGVLFYLSQSVEAPPRDEFDGKVTVTRTKDGARFDWTKVTGDVIRIHSSNRRPRDPAVAVPYRGTWFYISDDDLNSKSTFSLLSQLFSLQAGDVKMAVPLLTLPAGG